MYDRLKHTGWGINRLYWGDGPKNHTNEWTADRKAWKRSDAWQWVQQNLAEPKPKIIIEAHHGQLTRNPKPNLNPNPSPNPTPSPDPDPDPDPNANQVHGAQGRAAAERAHPAAQAGGRLGDRGRGGRGLGTLPSALAPLPRRRCSRRRG